MKRSLPTRNSNLEGAERMGVGRLYTGVSRVGREHRNVCCGLRALPGPRGKAQAKLPMDTPFVAVSSLLA